MCVRGVSGCVAWEHYVIFCSLLASIGIRQDCICARRFVLVFQSQLLFIAFFIIIKIKIKSWARYINKGQYSRVVIL